MMLGWGRPPCLPLSIVATMTLVMDMGCSRPQEPQRQGNAAQSQGPSGQVRSCDLPNLTAAEAPVQRQIRAQYDALTRAQQSRAADGELGAAFGDIGTLLLAAEYPDAAEACYLNAERLVPGEARWPYYLGHLYKDRGDGARATAAFERASRLQPNDPPTLVWLGTAYLSQGRATDAETQFAKAVSLDPRSAAALFGLGKAELANRRYAEAASHFEQALAIAPGASVVHYPLSFAVRESSNSPILRLAIVACAWALGLNLVLRQLESDTAA